MIGRDRFGNLVLDATPEQLAGLGVGAGQTVSVECAGRRHEALLGASFAQAPEGGLLLYEDSWGLLALAVNRGSAAELLGAGPGRELLLQPR